MPDITHAQELFAERIGGNRFGTDTAVYKFEKIKRAKAAAMSAQPGRALIDMGVGEPDDRAFDDVIDSLATEARKWENRTYADNGIMEFREAAAEYMQDLYGVALDPETEICHSIGSKAALSLLPACFINRGDATVLTVPGYPVLGTWTQYFGGEVVKLPLLKANGFLPDLEQLTETQRQKCKLLYLNYPNNPTGASAPPEFLDQAIRFAHDNKIVIVSDAAYAPLNFTGSPLSILSRPGGKAVAVELHSMSKGFNMTGWRLGWVCGNPRVVKAYAAVKDNSDSGQFRAIQKAAITALQGHRRITAAISAKYQRRLSALAEILRGLGFDAAMPQGSFYLYVEIPRATVGGQRFESGEAFCEWLIQEHLISTVPWDDAGCFVRFSATFAAPTIEDEERVLAELESRLKTSGFEF